MSKRKFPNAFILPLSLIGIVAVAVLTMMGGMWLARKTSPYQRGVVEEVIVSTHPQEMSDMEPATDVQVWSPPLFFFADTGPEADLQAVADEIRMAAEAGIRRFVVTTPLPWTGDASSLNVVHDRLRLVWDAEPAATVFLYLDLNPPEVWLKAHPEDTVTVNGRPELYPSIASPKWLADVKMSLQALLEGISDSPHADRVVGCIPACLENGQWFRTGGYDTSASNTAGFRGWLRDRYHDDEVIRETYANGDIALDTATIPVSPDGSGGSDVFFALPEMQAHVDYSRYLSEQTAEIIATIAEHIKESAGGTMQVVVPYGYSFELVDNEAGHCALESLLTGAVDGFISPVSYIDRGLGGVGGFMGPVHSALHRGKQWYVLDDSRTGVVREHGRGRLAPLAGVRVEDLYRVRQRNFAAAMTQELGLLWADSEGNGDLHDEGMWDHVARMREAYEKVYTGRTGQSLADPVTLAVVVDERSRFYLQRDKEVNERLVRNVRDYALQAGVSTRFCLLSDVMAGRVVDASVYLFTNAFAIPTRARERLHALLAKKEAAAVWLYAPGYIAEGLSVKNISATTGITTKAFEGVEKAGSVYRLDGNWMDEGDELGDLVEWSPLFYIDPTEPNVLATYRSSGRPSIAVTFLDAGWTSVYVAEPTLSVDLLREILNILEKHVVFQDPSEQFYDTVHFGPGLMAIHARRDGNRVLDLGASYDVRDLFDPRTGWTNKQVLSLSLESGETRLLHLTPVHKARSRGSG